MAKIEVVLSIKTDGDFDFHNEDCFFKEDFEEYSKSVFIEEKDLNELLNKF